MSVSFGHRIRGGTIGDGDYKLRQYLKVDFGEPYVTLRSASEFTLAHYSAYARGNWNGDVYVSTDKTNWTRWGNTSAGGTSVNGILYVRGVGVSHYSTGTTTYTHTQLVCRGSDPVYVIGNLENLLDWSTVANGGHPSMDEYCFYGLFSGSISSSWAELRFIVSLPSPSVPASGYRSMFGSKYVLYVDGLPATTLGDYCYSGMFSGCTGLRQAPDLPATTLAPYCYRNMFSNSSVQYPPTIAAEEMAAHSCDSMFDGCESLVVAPALLATVMAEYCCYNMFYGCKSLVSAPALTATTLADYCYNGMFAYCTALTSAPELPATTVGEGCYNGMFSGCSSLANMPIIRATTLGEKACVYMFNRCSSLVNTTELLALTAPKDCYYGMFWRCKSLITAPKIDATSVGESAMYSMFRDCSQLETPPSLPATVLGASCYEMMFQGCTALKAIPALPATVLPDSCYYRMFYEASWLVSSGQSATFGTPWRMPTTGEGTAGTNSTYMMLQGSWRYWTPSINTTYYAKSVV